MVIKPHLLCFYIFHEEPLAQNGDKKQLLVPEISKCSRFAQIFCLAVQNPAVQMYAAAVTFYRGFILYGAVFCYGSMVIVH